MNQHSPSLRTASNLLCLWALCGKPACRRAQQCKRNAAGCLARYAPLAPEDARLGALAVLQGARDGVGIDEVRRHVPGDVAAWESWTAQVHAARDGQARETVDHTDWANGD